MSIGAIQKKLVLDERGTPLEVIIPWAQYCELAEALGLDPDEEARTDLLETRRDLENGSSDEFTPRPRPTVGETLDEPIDIPDSAFAPLSQEELKAWGL